MGQYTLYYRSGSARTVHAEDPHAALALTTEPLRTICSAAGVPLLSRPAIDLPATLRVTDDELALSPLLRDREGVREALERGLLSGRAGGWLRRAEVVSASLVAAAGPALREGILAAGLEKQPRDVAPLPPLDLPGIDLPPGYEVPADARALVDATMAYHYRIVPISLNDGAVSVIAVDPRDLERGWELSEQIGRQVTLMSCSRDPYLHMLIAQDLLFRTYPEGAIDADRTTWACVLELEPDEALDVMEGWHSPVDPECEEPLESRAAAVLSGVHDLVDPRSALTRAPGERELELAIIAERARTLESKRASGADGLSWLVGPEGFVERERFEDRQYITLLDANRDMGAVQLLIYAAAAGIGPDVLPPATSTVEIPTESGPLRVTASLTLSDEGEELDLRWEAR